MRRPEGAPRKILPVLAMVAFLAAGRGSAQPPGDAFRDPFIGSLAGKWDLTRKIRGGEARNTVDVRWVLDHRFLEVHMVDVARPPKYEALVLIGGAGDGRYVAHWCDTYGGKYSAIGYGKRSGDSIEFEFAYSDGPFYNTFTWHPERREWTCRLENVDKDGKRILFAEDTLRRP